MKSNPWRTLPAFPLEKVVFSEKDRDRIIFLFEFLQEQQDKYLSNKDFINKMEPHVDDLKGDFKRIAGGVVKKDYLAWNTGANNSKYFIMVMAQIQAVMKSVHRRRVLAKICEKNDWLNDASLRKMMTEAGFYPTKAELDNICRDGKVPEHPKHVPFRMDYSTQDKFIVKNGRLNIGTGWWASYLIPRPSWMRDNEGHFSKPRIEKNENDEFVVLCSYEPSVIVPRQQKGNVLGIDLNRSTNAFRAAVVDRHGNYSQPLWQSREADRLLEKLTTLRTEEARLWAKSKALEKESRIRENLYLVAHWRDVEEQRAIVRHKLKRIRRHLAWVIARDAVHHAVSNHAEAINMENLKMFSGIAGKWEFSLIKEKIEEVAQLHGIRVVSVSPKDTSHTDPFTEEKVTPDRHRRLPSGLDRDYAAALNIAKPRKRRIKKKRVIVKPTLKKCRDKHEETPKRPHQVTRTHERKMKARAFNKYWFGTPKIVGSSAGSVLPGSESTSAVKKPIPSYGGIKDGQSSTILDVS